MLMVMIYNLPIEPNSSVYSLATRALGSSGINSHWGADIQIGPFDYDTLDNISKTGYVNLKVSDGQTSDLWWALV